MGNLNPAWLVVLAGVIGLLPLVVGLMTSYLKMSIVLGMLKSGLGTQQTPGTLVTMVLALALSLYVMSPTLEMSFQAASQGEVMQELKKPSAALVDKLAPIAKPWLDFMRLHAGVRELQTLAALSKGKEYAGVPIAKVDPSQVGLRLLLPAFILTEIKEGFAMAFVLLLPFMVIDLIVANVLVGMGMYMVSPVIIALPLKLLLFVSADGWLILAKGLIASYQG